MALAFVSLNGTAFSFDRNFDVLSFGDPSDGGNACGYWGCGTATKVVTSGSYPYVVSGTGEPHGTLHFPGTFNSLTWTSGNENWHGFTVGIAGTASEVVTDTTAPTVSISPAQGTTNVAASSNITITFNEEVRNLNDTPLTNTNVDSLITLKDKNASGADIPFDATIDATNKIITINPATDFTADQIIYVSIGATVEDTYNNAITATSATFTTGSSLSTFTDPRTKQDVVGNIDAWSNIAEHWAKANLDSITYRLDWLRRNKNAPEKFHQGARITTNNPIVDGLIRVASSDQHASMLADATQLAQKFFSGQDQMISDAKSTLTDAALSPLVQAAQKTFRDASSSSTENSLLESWSWWTQGEAVIGRLKGNNNVSLQRAHDYQAFIGMDRPAYKEGLFGLAIGLGKSDTNVGAYGSGVESNNYSFSGYTVFKLPSSQTVEATLGFGRLQMDIVRIDGSQTLSGQRDAHQIFSSVALRGEPLVYRNFSISPYGRLEATHTKLDAFSESGGDMALTFDQQYLNTTMAFIGADVEYATNIGNGRLRRFGKLEYGANTNHKSDVNMRYVSDTDATDYKLTLARRAASYWKTGLGFDYQLKNNASVSCMYSRTQAVNAGYLNSIKLQANIPFTSSP